jgi:nondiscriminating glutamyl-tRNA synthetase
MEVRTRIAPSPTGEMHIGHIRTVLYNYALAKHFNGKFIVRVEDTDKARCIEGCADRTLNVISEMGFKWDEGPYIQSERLDLYKKYAEELVAKGAAYYCFCPEERLEELRREQHEKHFPVTKYDKKCACLGQEEVEQRIKNGEECVIRLNVPKDEKISFDDAVYGRITVNSNDIDDQILLKSDGFPSYHLGVVVDDHLMGITHVMRGNDWIPSTPKHILLYKAFGWEPPIYAHLPNLKEVDGTKKLSKRCGSVAVIEFLKEGYLPEAMNNFLMFLGWNPGTEKEIYTLPEFIKDFSIEKIQKTDLVSFDRQKLLWFNGHYIRNMSTKNLWERIKTWAKKHNVTINSSNDEFDLKVLKLVQERMKILSEFNSLTHYFYTDPEIDQKLYLEFAPDPEKKDEILSAFLKTLENIEKADWNREFLDEKGHEILEENNYKPKEAFMTLRIAITGEKATPQIFDILEVLGRETVLKRLKKQISN